MLQDIVCLLKGLLLVVVYLLLQNTLCRKTMENIRTRMNFNLVNTKKRLQKFVAKPSFENFTIFNQHLVGVKNKKVNLLLNKLIYTGMTVLDLFKSFMYQFHYGYIKKTVR
jgi:hypothetical protein